MCAMMELLLGQVRSTSVSVAITQRDSQVHEDVQAMESGMEALPFVTVSLLICVLVHQLIFSSTKVTAVLLTPPLPGFMLEWLLLLLSLFLYPLHL